MEVYLMLIRSKDGVKPKEKLYKVGVSSNVLRRAKEIGRYYDVTVIETVELDKADSLYLETYLKRSWRKYRGYPDIKFPGHTEVLQNKLFLGANGVLARMWESINNYDDRKIYEIEKRERADYFKKRNYFKKNGYGREGKENII